MSKNNSATVLVIGAGIAGLTAARMLTQKGYDSLVLDKGRGVGGRLATRRIGKGRFDHGAQYFTARDAKFLRWLREWEDAGVVNAWSNGFPTPHLPAGEGHARYRSAAGMTAIAKYLAQDLKVRLQTQVMDVTREHGRWLAHTDDGVVFEGQALLLTPPLPQSIALLDAGKFELSARERRDLKRIEYDRCLALMVLFAGPSRLPSPGGLRFPGGAIAWIGDNYQKGVSPDEYAVTIHASPAYSRRRWDDDAEEIAAELLERGANWLHPEMVEWQLHRWRYARPTSIYAKPLLLVDGEAPLALAGDAFGGPRVEGAALSGDAAAAALFHALAGIQP